MSDSGAPLLLAPSASEVCFDLFSLSCPFLSADLQLQFSRQEQLAVSKRPWDLEEQEHDFEVQAFFQQCRYVVHSRARVWRGGVLEVQRVAV